MSACEVNRTRLLRPGLTFHRRRRGGERSEGRNGQEEEQRVEEQYNTRHEGRLKGARGEMREEASRKRKE